MSSINLPCTLETRVSKDNNPYICLTIRITENYEKVVFLDKSEIELIKLVFGSDKSANKITINKSADNT